MAAACSFRDEGPRGVGYVLINTEFSRRPIACEVIYFL